MSKYLALWEYVKNARADRILLTYVEIEKIVGVPVDHSFLTYKKELSAYGYKVGKISMKAKTIEFLKLE